jgi:hypothetical protein
MQKDWKQNRECRQGAAIIIGHEIPDGILALLSHSQRYLLSSQWDRIKIVSHEVLAA